MATGMGGGIPPQLAQQVSHCMGQLALPNPPDLKAVEATLTSLSGTAGFAEAMATIVTDSAATAQQQNLAAIFLRELSVSKHWMPGTAGHGEPEFVVPDAEKGRVRELIVNGLLSRHTLVRIQTAQAVAHIGSCDWPTAWPGLLDSLLSWAGGEAPVSAPDMQAAVVDGALRTLMYFTEHIPSTEVVAATSAILPRVLALWKGTEGLDTVFKCKAATKLLVVLRGLLDGLAPLAHAGVDDAVSVAETLVGAALSAAAAPLASRFWSPSASRVKIAVLSVLYCILENFASSLNAGALGFVQNLVAFTARLGVVYERVDVAGGGLEAAEIVPGDGRTSGYDSEGSDQGLGALVMQSTTVITMLLVAPCRPLSQIVAASLKDVFSLLLPLLQIPSDVVQDWLADPESFVAAEEDDSYADASARGNVLDFVGQTYHEFEGDALPALASAALSVLAPGAGVTRQGAQAAWKCHEAALSMLGTLGPQYCYMAKLPPTDGVPAGGMDVPGFCRLLHEIITSDAAALGATGGSAASLTTSTTTPCSGEDLSTGRVFVVGRALWAAGRFAAAVPGDLVEAFLTAALGGMNATHPMPLQLAACAAMTRFMRRLQRDASVPASTVAHVGQQAIGPLLAMVLEAEEGSRHVPLLTLQAVLANAPEVAAAHEGRVGPLIVALWVQHLNNPGMHDVMVPCMRSVLRCGDETAVATFAQRLLTPLASIIGNPENFPPGVAETACNVLSGIASAVPPALHGKLMELFPQAVNLVTGSPPDCTYAIAAGVSVISSFAEHLPRTVSAWSDPSSGTTGPSAIARALLAAMNPAVSDTVMEDTPNGIMALMTGGMGVGVEDAVALIKALALRLVATKRMTPLVSTTLVLAGTLQDEAIRSALITQLNAVSVPEFRDTLAAAADRTAGATPTGTEPALVALAKAWVHVMPFAVGEARRNVASLGLLHLLSTPGLVSALSGVTVQSSIAAPPTQAAGGARYVTRSHKDKARLVAPHVPLPVEMGLCLCDAMLVAHYGEDELERVMMSGGGGGSGGGAFPGAGSSDADSPFVDASDIATLSDMMQHVGTVRDVGTFHIMDWPDEDDELQWDDQEEEDETPQWLKAHAWAKADLASILRGELKAASSGQGPLAAVLPAVSQALPKLKLTLLQAAVAATGHASAAEAQ